MELERITVAFGSAQWRGDVEVLSAVVGPPLFSDGEGWAEFDGGGTRIAVGVPDDLPPAALMVKVPDLRAARRELGAAGWRVDEPVRGKHEMRAQAVGPGGLNVIVYEPLPRHVGRGVTDGSASSGTEPSFHVAVPEFKEVLSRFCSGVVVITAMYRGVCVGLTCQSFSSLSVDPPLVLWCVAKSSTSWPQIRAAGGCCVNVLAEGQEWISRQFAETGGQKYRGVSIRNGAGGAPWIDSASAHIECKIQAVYDGGDHEIAVGRVVAVEYLPDGRPLVYFRRAYHRLTVPEVGHV